jgi:hypothetical protein
MLFQELRNKDGKLMQKCKNSILLRTVEVEKHYSRNFLSNSVIIYNDTSLKIMFSVENKITTWQQSDICCILFIVPFDTDKPLQPGLRNYVRC